MNQDSKPYDVVVLTCYANKQLIAAFNSKYTLPVDVTLVTKAADVSNAASIMIWLINDYTQDIDKKFRQEVERLSAACHFVVLSSACDKLYKQLFQVGVLDVYEIGSWNDISFIRIQHQAAINSKLKGENKYLKSTLLESRDDYRMLIQQQVDAIILYDENGNILDVNNSAEKLLRYSEKELKQYNFFDLLIPTAQGATPIDIQEMKDGGVNKEQITIKGNHGKIIPTEIHTYNVKDGVFLASIRDLTDRLRAQEHLQKEKMLADKIINSLPGLFYMFNQKGQYMRWNRQLELVSGYSGKEIINMHPSDFFSKDEQGILEKEIGNVFLYGQSALEANLLTKYGTLIPYYFTGISIVIDNELCLLGMAIDLSPLRNLERKLNQQKLAEQHKMMQVMLEAEETQKNKLGLELHDNVNQMLSVVRLYLSTIHHEKENASVTITDAIEILSDAMEEIRSLSHSLAIAYKFDSGLVKAIEDLVDKIQAGKKITVSLLLPEALDERTDYKQKLCIYRIMQEQLNNIMKYANASKVDISISFTDHHLTMLIKDDGIGFDVASAPQGLGLMSMRNRAEALQGSFELISAPQAGTGLTINLPVVIKEPA